MQRHGTAHGHRRERGAAVARAPHPALLTGAEEGDRGSRRRLRLAGLHRPDLLVRRPPRAVVLPRPRAHRYRQRRRPLQPSSPRGPHDTGVRGPDAPAAPPPRPQGLARPTNPPPPHATTPAPRPPDHQEAEDVTGPRRA